MPKGPGNSWDVMMGSSVGGDFAQDDWGRRVAAAPVAGLGMRLVAGCVYLLMDLTVRRLASRRQSLLPFGG